MSDFFELPDANIVNEEEILLKAEQLLAESAGGKNISKRSAAIDEVVKLLLQLDEGSREMYVDDLSKRFKITKKVFNAKIKEAQKKEPAGGSLPVDIELPSDINASDALKKGFFKSKNAYYFITKENTTFKASNFVVEPILHIYSKKDNKRIIEVTNEHGERKTLDLPSKNLVSTDLFQQSVFNEGNFIFFGTKVHHFRVLSSVAKEFTRADELHTLGWQREGFFAFSNGIFNGAWQPVDEFGVTEHDKVKYFSPAFSKIYADVREDDDEYENDRFFVFKPSPITFARWCELMMGVYGPNGMVAVGFMIASVFRSFIYEKYKIFPHLFLFGEKQSGKSQLAWSLSNVFFDEMPAFNLNSGTQVGFFRRLGRVKNALCWFDEYTNDIDEKRFQALKSAYDGMGYEKGRMSRDNRTDTTKVNSACVISGQYLPTRDDNSLLTRSILLSFEKKIYGEEGMRLYNELKKYEGQGLSSLVTEVLKCRTNIEESYIRVFEETYDFMKNTMQEKDLAFDERLLRNYASILAPMKIVTEYKLLGIPWSFEKIMDLCINHINDQTSQITSSEAVSTFWLMIQFMFESTPQQIKAGEDFKVENWNRPIKLRNKKEANVQIDFSDEPKWLAFFRLSRIHPVYLENHRKQYGKNGVDYVSMQHYIKHHKAYLGYTDSTRFDNQITSAFVFDYKLLGINLEKEIQDKNTPDPSEVITPGTTTAPEQYTPLPPAAHIGSEEDLPF